MTPGASKTTAYDFYRHQGTASWALVLCSNAALPEGLRLHEWALTRTRTAEDTQHDVRREADARGYCLIHSGLDFDQLEAELRAATSSRTRVSGGSSDPESVDVAREAGEYAFYVHRSLPQWRMALRERERVHALTDLSEWQFSRARSGEQTAPAVVQEVAERGYSLFKIGLSLEQLAAALGE